MKRLFLFVVIFVFFVACQKNTNQQVTVPKLFTVEFPSQVTQSQDQQVIVLNAQQNQKITLNFKQYTSTVDALTFDAKYVKFTDKTPQEVKQIAQALLKSMTLQNTPMVDVDQLPSALKKHIYDYTLNQPFRIERGVMGKDFTVYAAVYQQGSIIVQLYAAGPTSPTMNEQSQAFMHSFKFE